MFPGLNEAATVESFFSGVQRLRQSEGGGPSPFRDNFLVIGCQQVGGASVSSGGPTLDVKAGT